MITIQRAAHFSQLLAKSMPSETKRMMGRRRQKKKLWNRSTAEKTK